MITPESCANMPSLEEEMSKIEKCVDQVLLTKLPTRTRVIRFDATISQKALRNVIDLYAKVGWKVSSYGYAAGVITHLVFEPNN